MQKKYIINGGIAGSERLKKLTKATWETTKYYLLKAGLKENMSVLDVGCGNGLITKKIQKITGHLNESWAIDFDAEIIEIAKEKHKKKRIRFLNHDISKEDFKFTKKFDFIIIRFLLTHVSNPEDVLKRTRKMLKKGGILYLEDIDFSGYFSYPQNDAFDRYVGLYKSLAITKGGDPYIGKKLYQLMKNENLNDIKVNSSNICYSKGVGKQIAQITLEEIYNSGLENNLINKKEGNKTIEELKKYTKQENSIISLPRIFYCSGIK